MTFSKALATEVMLQGIRVNLVAPGPVWTPLMPATYPPGAGRLRVRTEPADRAASGAAGEVSSAYAFLAS